MNKENKENISKQIDSFIETMKDTDIGFYILNAKNKITDLLHELAKSSIREELNEELVKQMLDSFINELQKLKGENE